MRNLGKNCAFVVVEGYPRFPNASRSWDTKLGCENNLDLEHLPVKVGIIRQVFMDNDATYTGLTPEDALNSRYDMRERIGSGGGGIV